MTDVAVPAPRVQVTPELYAEQTQRQLDMAQVEMQALAGLPFAVRMYFDQRLYQQMMTMAETIAKSPSMPAHVRGDPVMALYCIERGWSWRMSPLEVARGTFKIRDSIGHYGRVIIAAINSSRKLHQGLQFEHFAELPFELAAELWKLENSDLVLAGDDEARVENIRARIREIERQRPSWDKVTARFTEEISKNKDGSPRRDAETGEPVKYLRAAYTRADEQGLGVIVRGHLIGEDRPRELKFYLKQAWPRNSTLWAYDPARQICYTAGRAFGNLNTPELVLGVRDEDDFEPRMLDVTAEADRPRQPRAPAHFVEVTDLDGRVLSLQPGEIENWIRGAVAGADGDAIDALCEYNPDLRGRIEATAARAGPGGHEARDERVPAGGKPRPATSKKPAMSSQEARTEGAAVEGMDARADSSSPAGGHAAEAEQGSGGAPEPEYLVLRYGTGPDQHDGRYPWREALGRIRHWFDDAPDVTNAARCRNYNNGVMLEIAKLGPEHEAAVAKLRKHMESKR